MTTFIMSSPEILKKKDSTKELYISAWKRIIEPSDLYFSDLKDVDAKAIQEVYHYKTDYIFTTASGGFIDRHDVQHAMERYYKRIGIEK